MKKVLSDKDSTKDFYKDILNQPTTDYKKDKQGTSQDEALKKNTGDS